MWPRVQGEERERTRLGAELRAAGAAVACAAAALLLRLFLSLTIGWDAPFLLLPVGILAAGWARGARAGVYATALETLALAGLPVAGIGARPIGLHALVLFALEGLLVSAVAGSQFAARGELRRRAREQAALLRLSQSAIAARTPETLHGAAAEVALHELRLDGVCLLEHRPGRDVLRVLAAAGGAARVGDELPLELDSAPGYALVAREPVQLEDLRTEARFSGLERLRAAGARSAAWVPGGEAERPFVVVEAWSRAPRELAPGELRFLEGVAHVVAGTLACRVAEDALRRSRDEAQAVLESVADAVLVHAPDGRVLHANQAAALLLGHPSSRTLLGGPLDRSVAALELADESGTPLPASASPWALALDGRRPVERRVRHAAPGSLLSRRALVRSVPALSGAGDVELVITVFQDETERWRREQAQRLTAQAGELLAASADAEPALEGLARLALGRLADWCLLELLDEEGRSRRLVVHGDPAREKLARELEHQPATGGGVAPVARVLRSGRAEVASVVPPALLPALVQGPVPPELLGDLGVCAYACVPLVARGRTLGALALFSARADTYDAHDLLLAEDLAQRAALAVDASRVHRAAVDAERRRSELLATLGHELRNPLGAIRTAVRAARERPLDEAGARRTLDVLENQTQSIARLVDDLLDLARIAQGRLALRLERLDLVQVVAGSVETVRHLLGAVAQTLAVDLPREEVRVEGDPQRLEQVITNLLENAFKFNRPGGEVRLRVAREGDEAVVRVRDEGRGIHPEHLGAIFELFRRERSSGPGLGIGLHLVRRVLEMHRGSVTATSPGPGRGSEFVVRLPLDPAAEANERLRFLRGGRAVPDPAAARRLAEAAPSAAATAPPAPRLRVLVVDDHADSANGLAELLRVWGHSVRVAGTAGEALATAEEFHPGVVLLDIGLPGRSGYDLARGIRAREPIRDALLIAITGFTEAERPRRSREAGIDHHLTKPVDLDRLRCLIDEGRPAAG